MSHSVVLANPERVHGGKRNVLIRTFIAGQLWLCDVVRKQSTIADAKLTSLVGAQNMGDARVRTVDHRAIENRSGLVDLLSRCVDPRGWIEQ